MERRDPNELVDEDESDDDDDDDGSDEEDEDEEEEEEESPGEEESGKSDSEGGDDEAADQVRKKIEDALKASGVDVGEDDSAQDSDEEELMDDEQMMALDDTLADIFRTRTDERKSKQGPLTLFLLLFTCFFLDAQVNIKGSMFNEKQRISRTGSSIS